MKRNSVVPAAMKAMPLIIAGALWATIAIGQTASEPVQVEITVEAPRTVPRVPDASDPGSGGTAVLTYRTTVRYVDLDLSRPGDAARLMLRVNNAARYACKQLDRLYPLDRDTNCAEKASLGARPQAEAVIAAARSASGVAPSTAGQ